MAAVELKILCVLLFAAVASAEVTPMTLFEQFTGQWYRVALATNATSSKAQMTMGTVMIVPNKDGDFNLTCSEFRRDYSCFRGNNFFQKSEIPWCFVFANAGAKDNHLCVMVGKFDEYVLIHIIMHKEGKSVVRNELLSRTTTTTDGLKEGFRQFCLDTGIPEENLVILRKTVNAVLLGCLGKTQENISCSDCFQ